MLGAALLLAAALTAHAQTAETFKRSGPMPYGEYLRRTGQAAPKAKAVKRVAPKPKLKPPAGGTAAAPVLPPAVKLPPAPVAVARPAPPPVPAPTTPKPQSLPQTQPQTQPIPARLPVAARPSAPPLPAAIHMSAAAPQPGARLSPELVIPPAELEAFIDGAVRQAMAHDHLAGVAVSVVQDGRPVLEKGYGLARLSPAVAADPARTLFRLGSVSKVLTWIEVLKQVERGRLNPDAPIDDALPENLRLGPGGFNAPVRLRHLMTHTAGFESRELGRLFHDDPRRLSGSEAALRSGQGMRMREPGRIASYSSFGAALAGAAAANVANTPFDQLMESDLLKPAGLASTSFREPYPDGSSLPEPLSPALASRLADGFRWTGHGLQPRTFAYGQDFAPALSASASAHDMGRLMTLLLAPDQGAPAGIGPRVSAALFTPLQRAAPGLPGWTYGLQEETLAGGFAGFGHGGATPGFATQMLMVPQLRLGIFVAVNTESGGALAGRLPQMLVRRFYAADPTPAAPPQALADPGRYAGLYLTTRRAYHGLEAMVDRLTRSERVSFGPDGLLTLSTGDGRARQFNSIGDDRFRAVDGQEVIAFNADREGASGRRLLIDPAAGEAAARTGWIYSPALLAGAAGLATVAALLCLIGMSTRDWRDYRQTRPQALAGGVQAIGGLAWLLAVSGFLIFMRGARDPAQLMYAWPNPWLVGASWAAVAATALTALQLWQLRDVWADAHRLKEWTARRKLAHTTTTLVFAGFAILLLAWGALAPWSS